MAGEHFQMDFPLQTKRCYVYPVVAAVYFRFFAGRTDLSAEIKAALKGSDSFKIVLMV